MPQHYFPEAVCSKLLVQWQQADEGDQKQALLEELTPYILCLIQEVVRTFNFSIDWDDFEQDTFIHLVRKMPKFDVSRGKLFNWLTTIVVNCAKARWNDDRAREHAIYAYAFHKGDTAARRFMYEQGLFTTDYSQKKKPGKKRR